MAAREIIGTLVSVKCTITVFLYVSTCKPLVLGGDGGGTHPRLEQEETHIPLLHGGWKKKKKRWGRAQTSVKLNSDLAKCDYLEWVCIRFVCKYGINH